MKALLLVIPVCIIALASCGSPSLPVIGNPQLPADTAHRIAAFTFTDQDGNVITEQTYAGKIYVADFIFLSCPTICPAMNRQMLCVYKAYENDDRILFLSHSIDPARDSVNALRAYASRLGVASSKWHFVTGRADSIYALAKNSYFTETYPDTADPKSFIHSGGLLLIDKNRRIRGVYEGTDSSETTRLIGDIKILLKQQF